MTMGRNSLLLCVLLAGIAGCRTEQRRAAAPAQVVREHRTLDVATDAVVDTSFAMRDLFTSEEFVVEKRGAILLLKTLRGVIDTLSTPATLAHALSTVHRIDSSFLEVSTSSADTLSGESVDLVCVADGGLHWSARLPSLLRLPQAPALGVYSTTHTLLRSPLALNGGEIFSPTMSESGAGMPWRQSFDLRFDDSTRAFYNVSLPLDSVPVAGGDRIATGSHPAIALRTGTSVMIDGWWYTLSVPEDLDLVEFARGTVGMVLEGKGEWGDTLRAIAVVAPPAEE